MFQFQYGTIKGRTLQESMPLHLLSFNSNMVRLKAHEHKAGTDKNQFQFQYGTIKGHSQNSDVHVASSFNSNMVRLKAYLPAGTLADAISFNSNMVRLKAPQDSFFQIAAKFQFQYGTIKGSTG